MEEKPNHDSIVVGTGGTCPPLDGGITDNNEEEVTTTMVTPPPIMMTGLDVAALCKLVEQPINFQEIQLTRMIMTYIADQGGPNAILQRSSSCRTYSSSSMDDKNNVVTATVLPIENIKNNIDLGLIGITNRTCTDAYDTDDFINEDGLAPPLLGIDHDDSRLIITTTTTTTKKDIIADLISGPRTKILNYLDPKTLIEACCVNKRWYQECTSDAIETPIVPYFRLTLDLSAGYDPINIFVRNMNVYYDDAKKRKLLNGYQRFELHVIGSNAEHVTFDCGSFYNAVGDEDGPKMEGIVSWIVTCSLPSTKCRSTVPAGEICESPSYAFPRTKPNIDVPASEICELFSYMFPNLRHLDVSKTGTAGINNQLYNLYYNLYSHHLEKLIVSRMDRVLNDVDSYRNNSVHDDPSFILDVSDSNLIELYLDNCTFEFKNNDPLVDNADLSTLVDNADPSNFLFDGLPIAGYKLLERLSIRNALYSYNHFARGADKRIPQNILIKFVRNAPSTLTYLRSDLSQDNIVMLKQERPTIEFVN